MTSTDRKLSEEAITEQPTLDSQRRAFIEKTLREVCTLHILFLLKKPGILLNSIDKSYHHDSQISFAPCRHRYVSFIFLYTKNSPSRALFCRNLSL